MRIIIHGINGKMGTVLLNAALQQDFEVVAGIDKQQSAVAHPFPVFYPPSECDVQADVLIDFSRPDAAEGYLELCTARRIPVVIATTGFSDKEREKILKAAQTIPIFLSANMSLGVNLQIELIKRAAAILGKSFDIEIIEKHHRMKVDSPSGTALALANALNEVRNNELDYTFGRHSTADRRTDYEVGIHAIRGGTIIGEHEVIFCGPDEIIEITHRAQSRSIFASGALRAARYIVKKSPGLYSMRDMLSETISE